MARRKNKKRKESVLASVFGVELEAAPNPQPEVNPPDELSPEVAAKVAATNALADERERLADMAFIRAAAVFSARDAGVKPQRAQALVGLLDFSGVGVNSDGEPDGVEIARIVKAGCEEYPEFRQRHLYDDSRYRFGGSNYAE